MEYIELIKLFYEKILCNQVVLSLISGFVGAIIASIVAYRTTKQAHENNIKLEKLKEKETEKAVVLSIVEELKVLKNTYEKDMDVLYNKLSDDNYIEGYYTITQDFMTIYSSNANKLGMVQNEELRNLIIKSYTYLKKYIEYLLNYATDFTYFEKCRSEFIARAFPKVLNSACSRVDNTKEINAIKEFIRKNDWNWLDSPYLNEVQVINFLHSNDEQICNLKSSSKDLKQKYTELKNLIEKTADLALNIYKR